MRTYMEQASATRCIEQHVVEFDSFRIHRRHREFPPPPEIPGSSSIFGAGYPRLESVERFGILVPAGTPPDTIAALHNAISGALRRTR
jgi:hypothetical protein